MPLGSQEIADWLKSLEPQPPNRPWPPFLIGPYIPEMPAKAVFVTMLDGLGYSMEAMADNPSFQIRVRGDDNDQNGAEELAYAIDAAILAQTFPQTTEDGTNLMIVKRLAGSPATLGPPDDAFRYEYVCSYLAQIGVPV
jgi:Bacteriophage minor capsid protein